MNDLVQHLFDERHHALSTYPRETPWFWVMSPAWAGEIMKITGPFSNPYWTGPDVPLLGYPIQVRETGGPPHLACYADDLPRELKIRLVAVPLPRMAGDSW